MTVECQLFGMDVRQFTIDEPATREKLADLLHEKKFVTGHFDLMLGDVAGETRIYQGGRPVGSIRRIA